MADNFDAASAAQAALSAEAGDGSEAEQLAIEARMYSLHIEQAARDKIAAESAPVIPDFTAGADFLAQTDPEPPWRIHGLWPAGGNVVLSAQFKAGKTTLRDNLIRCWCDGAPFLGRYEITPTGGRIAVIDAEMPRTMARRWLNAQRIADAGRFAYVNIRGGAAAFNMLVPTVRGEWVKRLVGAGAAGLLLDCLGPVLAALGLDENSGADVGRFIAGFEQMLAAAGIPESMVIHHMGHSAERSRGASRLRDWPDAAWQLVRQDDNPASARYLSAFGRDVDMPESRLDYDPSNRWLTLAGGSRSEEQIRAARGALTDFLTGNPESSYRAIEAALAEEHPRQAIRRAIKAAVADGAVLTRGGPRNAILHWLAPS